MSLEGGPGSSRDDELAALRRHVLQLEKQLQERPRPEPRVSAPSLIDIVLEQLPLVLWATDRELRFTLSLGAGLRGLGLRPNETVEQSLHDFFGDPAGTSIFVTAHQQALDGSPVRYEAEWQGRTYETVVQPIQDGSGGRIGCLGVALDVTERKQAQRELRLSQESLSRMRQEQAEAALRETEARYLLLADHATDIISRHRPDSTFVYVSPSAQTVVGYSPAELEGQVPFAYAHPLDVASMREAHERLLATRVTNKLTYRFRCRDGAYRWLESTARVVCGREGEVNEIVVVSRDVSDRVEAERLAQKLRDDLAHVARLSTLGELASGLAHELMQPLAILIAFSEGCVRRLRAHRLGHEELVRVLEEVVTQANLAGKLVHRLRNFVRKGKQIESCFNLNVLIIEVLGILGSELKLRSVRVHSRLADRLPYLMGDQAQIQQVILNLIRNAMEAMDRPDCEPRVLTICTARPHSDEVTASVCDTGPGMSPDDLASLGKPFFTTKENGLGLGLAISRTIVEAHEGQLWGVPNPEGGMTFNFNLKVAPEFQV